MPLGELIVCEVQTPALVGQGQNKCRSKRSDGSAPITSPSRRQLLLAVLPLGLLAVDHDALPQQQDMQTAIAKQTSLLGELP